MEYEYKVTAFEASVSMSEFKSGKAGPKVCAQLEILLQEHARNGWELQGQYQFQVEVKAGCFDKLFGGSDEKIFIYQLVFRKPM
jgi:hypothetical protein